MRPHRRAESLVFSTSNKHKAGIWNMTLWEWLLVVMLATVVANGLIARAKSRSVFGWVILGLMFNPVALVVLLFLPSNTILLPSASSPAKGTASAGTS